MNKYILNDQQQPVLCHDLMTWGRWMENGDQRRVALDTLCVHGEDVQVSTVFLGVDHRFTNSADPILWETLVFGGPLDGEMERYTSHADALAGHVATLERVRAAQ